MTPAHLRGECHGSSGCSCDRVILLATLSYCINIDESPKANEDSRCGSESSMRNMPREKANGLYRSDPQANRYRR